MAVVGDEAGPGALIRISDPRTCERYPHARPDMAGFRFVVAHVELVALRGDFLGPWVPGTDRLVVRRADPPGLAGYPSRLRDAPGMHQESALRTGAGFTVVTDMAWEVPGGPATDLLLEFRHAEETVQLGVPADVAWAIGPIPAFDGPGIGPGMDPPIDPAPASGRLTLADPATVLDGDGAFAVQVDRFDQVEAYPGFQPAGGAFVEVWVAYTLPDIDRTDIGAREWRAVDGRGTELAFLDPPESRRHAVPSPLLQANPNIGWLIIDAPPEGEIRLEYRRAGEGPVLFEVLVREG